MRVARYAATAGVAAVVDLGGFAALDALGVGTATAAALSWAVANVVNYRLSARHAFDTRPTLRLYPRFALAAALGAVVNVGVTVGLSVAGMPDVAAKAGGIGVAFAANYLLAARVVFARR